MTDHELRDNFAAAALTAYLASFRSYPIPMAVAAAYEAADAMMEEREKPHVTDEGATK